MKSVYFALGYFLVHISTYLILDPYHIVWWWCWWRLFCPIVQPLSYIAFIIRLYGETCDPFGRLLIFFHHELTIELNISTEVGYIPHTQFRKARCSSSILQRITPLRPEDHQSP
ncbi:hypothetical protein BDQ94DRAFT_51342 [Aspergillus welwitschiae]|uniref:Uncharacterized protein n=1 Tax=Aspergillus welwitschiae TaxID=1341132 RepID=A0A3F3PZ90_9EURO|nr:hypothetical protein BDQ94DRAFT_51342 [Aspergillus welwitschiae]RDH32259.1 hypothetical protein BDQ94DRAFT_51342 [Aspergillus welwitschiae]